MKAKDFVLPVFPLLALLAVLAGGVMVIAEYSVPLAAGTGLVMAVGNSLGVRRAIRVGKEEGSSPVAEAPDGFSLETLLKVIIGLGVIWGLIEWTSTFSEALTVALAVCVAGGFLASMACTVILGSVSVATRRALLA